MKNSIVLIVAAFLCLINFPTITVGKNMRFGPKPFKGWPHPSEIYTNEMFMSTSHRFNYRDSKVLKCTYSNGSAPAISISPSAPSTPSPPPRTPSPPPSLPPPTPKKSPSPPPPTPSLPPPTPKSPSPSPPSSIPPPENHHSHHHHNHHEYPLEHFRRCMRNMGPAGMCRGQMEMSFYTRMFQVSKYCCNLMVEMKNECDDVVWGFFNDPYFVPLVRFTCHVTF